MMKMRLTTPITKWSALKKWINMITVQGKQIETDAFGYLLNIADWNEYVAKHIANLEDV